MRFSPDGTLLAVAGGNPGRVGEVQIWDVAKRTLRLSHTVTFDTLYGLSWSHDGVIVAFGCGDNTTRAIDVKRGKQVFFQGAHGDWVLDTIFSKDSSHLVTVSRDRSMKLNVVKTQQFVDNITSITPGALKGGIMAVDRNPEKDELLVGGADGVPKIYQMHRTKARKIGDDYNRLKTFAGMPGRIFDVEYSPDAKFIAAGSSLDSSGELRVYNAADAKLIATYKSETSPIYALSYRHDGKAVAIGGFDGIVRVIDATNGKVLTEIKSAPVEKPKQKADL